MARRPALTALLLASVLFPAACSGDGGTIAAPTTTTVTTAVPGDSSTTSATSAVPTSTSTTSAPPPVTASPDDLAADGINSPEDASVFVMTSWISGDRDGASRHATDAALDVLFAADAPAAGSLELVSCDSSDLERFDCFLVAEGAIYVIGVELLHVVEATIDDG